MPKQTKSELTKAAVLNASKKLFYENGYVDTHYNDIVNASGVNAGSVYYHFKKKKNIAAMIVADLTLAVKLLVNEYFSEYDLQIKTAIETRIFWMLVFNDEKYKKFHYEIAKHRVYTTIIKMVNEWLFDMHEKRYALHADENHIKMISLSCAASEAEQIIHLVEGHVTFTQEECARYDIKLIFQLMNTDAKRIEEIIAISRDVLSGWEISFQPDFQICLKK